MYDKDRIIEEAKKLLTDKRLKHTLGVRDTALELAHIYDADPEKVEIAAFCHDIFRGRKGDDLNNLVKKYGLPERYFGNANLAHGKLAACYLEKELGIDDPEIINAVSFHTTGRPEMSLIEKIVFIADAIEPGRDYDGVEKMRQVVRNDIDLACLMSLSGTVEHLIKSGVERSDIDKDTLNAINYFEDRRRSLNDK